MTFYHQPGVFSQLGVVLVRPWKSMKFQCISNTPENHLNGVPRPPNVLKMRSKQVPEIIKITKTTKTWNPMKTTVFAMFLKGWDITNQLIFQSKIIKNYACNPNMLFDTPNHRKYQKVTQNGLLGTQQRHKNQQNPIIKYITNRFTFSCFSIDFNPAN